MRERSYTVSEYLRNREIRIQLAFLLALGGAGIGMSVRYRTVAIALMWSAMAFFHLGTTYLRYRRIAVLAGKLDERLDGEHNRLLEHVEEGELSILENEINKLLSRLWEQNRELAQERRRLADALADLSHQLRTPLTSMNLVCAMLEEECQTGHPAMLRKLLARVQWLIDVLLKMSKLDAGAVVFQPQECRLGGLAARAVEPLLIPLELAGVRLILEVEEGAALCCDPGWMMEAIANIVKNCMEHTPEDGEIRLAGRENAIYTELVITDTGEGIDKKDLPHVFERFYKGERSSEESVGIGLALAGMIVREQNGTIRAENENGGGARFTIRIYKDGGSGDRFRHAQSDDLVTDVSR